MTPTITPPVSNSFTRMLSEIRQGAPLADLSLALQNCVAAVKEKGKSAQINYPLKLSPQGNAVIVTDDIEVKLPKEERQGAVFFPTEENTLSRKVEKRTFPSGLRDRILWTPLTSHQNLRDGHENVLACP